MRKTCLDMVYEIAKNNKVIFVGSDLGAGVLDEFKKKFLNALSWKVFLSSI